MPKVRQGLPRSERSCASEVGWKGRNFQIDVRWPVGDAERAKTYAAELVALAPDAIFAIANAQLRPLSRETRSIPIVFLGASDPIGAGYVKSFARPGGNITGFTLFEASMAGKWLSMLKEVAPGLTRVAIMVNPDTGMLRGTFYLQRISKVRCSARDQTGDGNGAQSDGYRGRHRRARPGRQQRLDRRA